MYPYRVFLSYTNAERELAARVVAVLDRLGLRVVWDHGLVPGQPFTEEIKNHIARCHLFIPLLTRKSLAKPWVHQETGYAMGVGVPILPIVIGDIAPVALIQQLQAIRVGEDLAQLPGALAEPLVDARVEDGGKASHPNFELVELPERRALEIVHHARDAQRRGGGRVRQRGAITSFSLPDVPPPDPAWREREGHSPRSRFMHEQQYQERVVLGELAAKFGCDLVIDPTVSLAQYGPAARCVRLRKLRAFLLDEARYPDVRAVVWARAEPGNLLLVGDWFYAEAMLQVPGAGYRQTLFTWHAPTVLARLKEFDRQFAASLQAQDGGPERSRFVAAAAVEAEINGIKDAAAQDRVGPLGATE
ncbi:MAG TPA: toll/interleukin-1 receptor domain-containing protein [Pyrinomonadaceae bacterium]|jgi:hypothetical protein